MPKSASRASVTNPLWNAYPQRERDEYPRLGSDISAEVVVVGGGILGAVAAAALVKRGIRPVLIEAKRVGGGVTAGTTGKVTSLQQIAYTKITDHAGERGAQAYALASMRGVEVLAELIAELEIDCQWQERDAFTFAMEERDVESITKEIAAANAAGIAAEFENHHELPLGFPAAARLKNQAQFNAPEFVRGVVASLAKAGKIDVYEETRVRGISEKDGGVTVKTDEHQITAGSAVVATHFPILDRGLWFARLEPKRSYCSAARLQGDPPQGMYISASSEPSISLRSAPAPDGDGELLIVGGSSHSVGRVADDPHLPLERFARQHFDVKEFTHRWSAQDNMTGDRLPYIGPAFPGARHLHTATGFNKWGLATAAYAGERIADAIAEEKPYEDTFSTSRVGSLVPQLRHNVETASHFVVDSVLDRSAPRCTHMGCKLKRNEVEGSWDCPCHGSRFAADGSIINGPAVKPLDLKSAE